MLVSAGDAFLEGPVARGSGSWTVAPGVGAASKPGVAPDVRLSPGQHMEGGQGVPGHGRGQGWLDMRYI